MGVKVNGWQLHHLRFADIVLITRSISQTERMMTENMWMHRSSAESTKDDAGWVGLEYPIHAQRNKHIRMHQLHLFGSGIEHDERPDPRAGQEKMSGLGSVQEHRGCSEED
ncbi:hypothetical protein RB195_003150 [Necator americanus]|uniref:Reverse transcriptase domain-containing protein n=1 Tax=Necator americanus TaxID=51031 RepID=A0ABR1DN19_NECAM